MAAPVINLPFVSINVVRLLTESMSMLTVNFRNDVLLFSIVLNVVEEADLALLWSSLSLNISNRLRNSLLDLFLLLLDLLHHRGLLGDQIHDGLHLVRLLLANSFLGRCLLHGKLNACFVISASLH